MKYRKLPTQLFSGKNKLRSDKSEVQRIYRPRLFKEEYTASRMGRLVGGKGNDDRGGLEVKSKVKRTTREETI
jgi:hypothetical protein